MKRIIAIFLCTLIIFMTACQTWKAPNVAEPKKIVEPISNLEISEDNEVYDEKNFDGGYESDLDKELKELENLHLE